MICPECGRDLEPKIKGPFRIMCWPTHNMAAVSRMRTADYNEFYLRDAHSVRNADAARDNEIRCPNSGQPV